MPRTARLSQSGRKAAILLVVVVLLTLFLVIGMCFVLFAEAQATSARFYREANNNILDKYPTPEEMFQWSMGDIIYDAPDDTGYDSAIRGHGLARNMYGWNYAMPMPGVMVGQNNETPFNGVGKLSTTQNPWAQDDRRLINFQYFNDDPAQFKRDPERFKPYVAGDFNVGAYTGGFNPPYTFPDLNNIYLAQVSSPLPAAPPNEQSYLIVNTPSYWRGDDPRVMFRHPTLPAALPALHPLNQAWTDPTPVAGAYSRDLFKYLTLRPRPVDQLTQAELAVATEASVRAMSTAGQLFPLPQVDPVYGSVGDVINLPGSQRYDSVWIDLGYETRRLAASGRKIKPMFAILIVDLDGRVNLNVAGNVKEGPGTGNALFHGSNQGFGAWEVNPRYTMRQDPTNPAFTAQGNADEYLNLFRGQFGVAGAGGRYGHGPQNPPMPPPPITAPTPNYPPYAPLPTIPNFPVPNAANLAASVSGNGPKGYARVEWDGSSVRYDPMTMATTYGPPTRVLFSQAGTFTAMPTFPNHFQDGNPDERYFHPSLFNPFRLNQPATSIGGLNQADRLLPVRDMEGLLAWRSPVSAAPNGSPYMISPDTLNTELARLMPNNLQNYPRFRNLITTHSMDLDRAGASPGIPGTSLLTLPNFAQPPRLAAAPFTAQRNPQGAGTVFNDGTAASILPNRNTTPVQGGDMRDNDWRSTLPLLGRVNLNRKLRPYPPVAGVGQPYNAADPLVQQQYIQAYGDRINLCGDIFERLRQATNAPAIAATWIGLADANTLSATERPQFEALRYLAQLAVNIVDFIDEDDVMTAYNFLGITPVGPAGWVMGTEQPRVVINEVYAQANNHPTDDFGPMANHPYNPMNGNSDPDSATPNLHPQGRATRPYRVNFWVELHNPHNADPNLSENGAARLQFTSGATVNPYKLVIRSEVDTNATRGVDNVTGEPRPPMPMAKINLEINNFTSDGTPTADTNVVQPSNGAYAGASGNNIGYYVLGPSRTNAHPSGYQADFPKRIMGGMPMPPFQPTTSVQDSSPINRMYVEIPNEMSDPMNTPAAIAAPAGMPSSFRPSVFLQRLANPNLPHEPNPLNPSYNPFVTVDYIQDVPINDAICYDATTPGGRMSPPRMSIENRAAYGRRQPFKASGVSAQNPVGAPMDEPKHTMFRQNGRDAAGTPQMPDTIDSPFQWMVHYDRNLANPMDLLHVSGWKPHELTQEFMNQVFFDAATGQINNPSAWSSHLIPWRDPATRLHRGLELMGVQSFMHGIAHGGRVPGKININTMTDMEVFQALCDPQFDPAQQRHFFDFNRVNMLWNQVQALRPFKTMAMPNDTTGTDIQYLQPDPTAANGVYRNSVENSALRQNILASVDPAAIATPADLQNHPYVQEELFKKIAGNFTTRSNTFAVFITTGFFEVRDDSTIPVKLGQEIDPGLRHKFFAIVDRTNLSIETNINGLPSPTRMQGGRPIFFPLQLVPTGTPASEQPILQGANAPVQIVVPAHAVQGNTLIVRDTIDHHGNEYSATSGASFSIFQGQRLFLGVGGAMEVVRVTSVVPNVANPSQSIAMIQAINPTTGAVQAFANNHYGGDSICTERIGNPGPIPVRFLQYDNAPYADTVVPHRVILQ